MVGRMADGRMQNNLGTARQAEKTRGGQEPNRCMRLKTLRQAEAIWMGLFRIGHMRAKRHFGAEWCAFRVKGRSWRGTRQKSLEHKRIEGEGREPLPQHILKCCPCLAHGGHRASKSRLGQATREDVMGAHQPRQPKEPLGGARANLLK